MYHVGNPFESPATINFCPGILGIERGLKRAGVNPRIVAYVEIESFIIANLLASMEAGVLDPAPIWTDAKTFDARPFRGRVHGFIAGYPCPGESVAGLREGHLYKGFIWPAIRRAIAAARPLWCFFENVDDHLTGTFPIVLRSLRLMGYSVEAGIYSAEEVGAPHERKRIFILAKLGDAASNDQWNDWIGETLRGSESSTGRSGNEELANTNIVLSGRQSGSPSGQSRPDENKTQGEDREWSGRESGNGSDQVANADNKPDETFTRPRTDRQRGEYSNSLESGIIQQEDRQEGAERTAGSGDQMVNTVSEGLQGRSGDAAQEEWEGKTGSITQASFPLGQGQYQWEWEEERTIESGLVYTINGYNFTSDLHRAIGNSVVEQTAEIAFLDLLKKHRMRL